MPLHRLAIRTLVLLSLLLLAACAKPMPGSVHGTITQVGTIDALLAGHYDGTSGLADLLAYGDTGIGTFDRLDGEMVVADGVIYQVHGSGEISVNPQGTTPFAAVCRFDPDRAMAIQSSRMDFDALKQAVDQLVPSQNAPLAILAHGTFSRVHTRAVPAQDKPYPPLAEVTRDQPEFTAENISGTLLGFRLPPFVKGINVTGYHMHFISDDATFGGHVLDFAMADATIPVLVQLQSDIVLKLPVDNAGFLDTDQSLDRSQELEEVEN